jgi:rod shape-determining protein MreC
MTTTLLANRSARRRGIVFAVLLTVTVVLMAFSSSPAIRELQSGLGFALRPIQGALDSVAGGVASVASAISDIDHLRVDNAALRTENARLQAENEVAQEAKRENDLLTGLLQLQSGFDHKTTAAAVIGQDSSEFTRSITIDKGSSAGIAVGDSVIASGGALAGRVTVVGPDSATVVLLTDASSTVIGQLVTSAASGEVVGQLGGVLVMNQIDSSERIALGDEVVTAGIQLASGIRSPYPKGLIIGQVVDVRRDANDVVQTAYLQPTADLDSLEYVLVITDYEGGLPPVDQQPVDCSATQGTLPVGEQPCYTATPKPKATATPRASVAPSTKP